MNIEKLFDSAFEKKGKNLFVLPGFESGKLNQDQVRDSYNFQWNLVNKSGERDLAWNFQKDWYLKLYGFETEENLKKFLRAKRVILDAGSGLGYKAAWFAELAPESVVIGMDISEGALLAAENFKHIPNLYYVRGDLAQTGFKDGSINYISCDQVLQHTEDPEKTLREFARIIDGSGDLAVYVYRKKALPRELLDDYFRKATHGYSEAEKMEMSAALTKLGKVLSELNIEIDFPDIPIMGIKGGRQDLQRFIYWNFVKCFWNEKLGTEISVATNYDWYSPSNAARYSEEEFKTMLSKTGFGKINFFRSEEACYTARASK